MQGLAAESVAVAAIRRAWRVVAVLACMAAFGVVATLAPSSIRSSGTIHFRYADTVRAPVSGQIAIVAVTDGRSVDEGDVLLELNTEDVQSRLRGIESRIRDEQINVDRQQRQGAWRESELKQSRASLEAREVSSRAQLRARLAEVGDGRAIDVVLANYVVGSSVILDQAVAQVRDARSQLEQLDTRRRNLAEDNSELRRALAAIDADSAEYREVQREMERLRVRAPRVGVFRTVERSLSEQTSVSMGEALGVVTSGQEGIVTTTISESAAELISSSQVAMVRFLRRSVEEDRYFSAKLLAIDSKVLGGGVGGGTVRVTLVLTPQPASGSRDELPKWRDGSSVEVRIPLTRNAFVWQDVLGTVRRRFQ